MSIEIFNELRKPPCLIGIHEHFERANWFFQLGNDVANETDKFRFHMAALYFSWAIVQIMIEAAKKQEVKGYTNPEEGKSGRLFSDFLRKQLPCYALIEKIRLHDFHRFGCLPPNSEFKTVMYGGPVKLHAIKGGATVQLSNQGPSVITTGQSLFTDSGQRSLLQEEEKFFDEESKQWYRLDKILDRFLGEMPKVLNTFETLII